MPAGKCRITLCPCEDLQFPWDLSVCHCWPFPDTQLPIGFWVPAAWFSTGRIISEEKTGYTFALFTCAHIHWFEEETVKGQARKPHIQTPSSAESLGPKEELGYWLAACALGVKKQTPFCWTVCLSTKVPILPKSGKVVYHHKNHPKPKKIKKKICFHPGRPWGSSMAEWHLLSLFAWLVSWVAFIIHNIWWFAGFHWCWDAFEDIF